MQLPRIRTLPHPWRQILIREGRSESKSWSQRVYPYRQLRDLFIQSSFTDLQPYASVEKDPFKLASRQLLLIATANC